MRFTRKFGALFIFSAAFVSLFFFVVLFSSTRFLLDDFTIALYFREGSFFSAFKWYYFNSSFRTTAMFITRILLGGPDPGICLTTSFIYYMLLICFFVFVVYKVISEVFPAENNSTQTKVLLAAFSLVQVAGLYFLCSDRIEIFGWITSTMVHALPVIIALLAFRLIIKRRTKKSDYVFLFVGAISFAGCAEQVVASVLLIAAVYAAGFFRKKRRQPLSADEKNKMTKTIFFAAITTVVFICVTTNPGILKRYEETQELSVHNNFYDFKPHLFLFKSHKLIGILIAVVSWLLFPVLFAPKQIRSLSLKPFLFIFSVTVVVTLAASKISYNHPYVTRMYFGIDTALYMLLAAVVLKYAAKIKGSEFLIVSGGVACLALLVMNSVRHTPPLLRYASAYDAMVTDLQAQPADKTIHYQLPDADLACPLSMGENPEDIRNQEFCRFYGIKAKVSFNENPGD